MADVDFDDRPPLDPEDDPRYRDDNLLPEDREEEADRRREQLFLGWNVIEGEHS